MRSLLFLSSLLLLTACGDSTDKTASQPSLEKQSTQKAKTEVIKETSKPVAKVTKSPSTGHSIYAHKCASCHGLKAQKKALNKSQIIAGWDAEKITEILKGYQDGSYGGSMKGIMKGQVSTLDDQQITLLSLYISKL